MNERTPSLRTDDEYGHGLVNEKPSHMKRNM